MTPAGPAPSRRERALLLLFPALAFLLLWEVLAGGRVLLPAAYLLGMSPWSAMAPAGTELPQWNALQWDGMAEFYPWRLYAARSIAAGQIPLWNPYVLSGTPFLANSQSAPLYPLHLLYYLPLGAETAVRMGWLAFLHLTLAGVFAYWLARELGARPLAAALGGAAFELSGFAVAWLELPSFLSVGCWIPLLLLCLSRAVRQGSWRWAAGAAAACGMMLLGGHLQIALYGLLAAGCFWLWETVSAARGARHAWPAFLQRAGLGAAVLGVGFALAAAQLLPAVELSRISHRVTTATEAGWQGYAASALPLQNWVTLLAPDYYGLPARGDFWGTWIPGPPNTMEYAGHVGTAAFVLALVGLFAGARVDRRAWLAALIGAAGLLLSTASPLARAFYFYVPGFAQSGSPARALVLLCLSLSLLAALGAEWVLRRSEEDWRRALVPLAAGLGGTVLLLGAFHLLAQSTLPGVSRLDPAQVAELTSTVSIPALSRAALLATAPLVAAALLGWLLRDSEAPKRAAAAGWALLLPAAAGGLLLGGAYNLTAPPSLAYPATPVTDFLSRAGARVATINRRWDLWNVPPALLPPNASLAYGWRDAQGYDSLSLGHYRPLVDALAGPGQNASPPENGNMVFIKRADAPLLPLLGARYVVSQEPLRRAGLKPAPGSPPGSPYVYEDSTALPEAFAVSEWFTAPDAEGLARLATGPGSLPHLVFVAPGSDLPRRPPPSDYLALGLPASVTRHRSGDLTVSASLPGPMLLVLLEGYAPGWRAEIRAGNDAPRAGRVLRVNGAFQGVLAGPGAVTVRWRYEPASFRLGLFLSLAAMALLLGTLVSIRKPPSRSRPD